MSRVIFIAALLALSAGSAAAHSTSPSVAPPSLQEIAAGDATRGAESFRQVCAACHTVEKGARRRVGPNLFAITGARIAQKPDYPYTEAFRRADITWDDETLAAFLAAPAVVVPGTKMDWALRDTKAIADVIAYLKRFQ